MELSIFFISTQQTLWWVASSGKQWSVSSVLHSYATPGIFNVPHLTFLLTKYENVHLSCLRVKIPVCWHLIGLKIVRLICSVGTVVLLAISFNYVWISRSQISLSIKIFVAFARSIELKKSLQFKPVFAPNASNPTIIIVLFRELPEKEIVFIED